MLFGGTYACTCVGGCEFCAWARDPRYLVLWPVWGCTHDVAAMAKAVRRTPRMAVLGVREKNTIVNVVKQA